MSADPKTTTLPTQISQKERRSVQRRVVVGQLVVVTLMCVAAGAHGWHKPLARQGMVHQTTGYVIDINRADVDTLNLLPGIGPRLAERIVAYRQAQGGYESVAQLDDVLGIGPKTLAQVGPLVTVEADDGGGKSDYPQP